MKKNISLSALFMFLFLSLTGCDVIGGIFKTGVGVGVFVVVVVLIAIFLISRMVGRK